MRSVSSCTSSSLATLGGALDRRAVLGGGLRLIAWAALGGMSSAGAAAKSSRAPDEPVPALLVACRRQLAICLAARRKALERLSAASIADHRANGDEQRYVDRRASYSKALPHDGSGLVDRAAYDRLLAALRSGEWTDFETVPLGGWRKLGNPQAAYSFELVGPHAVELPCPPAPRFDSPEQAAEVVELYWHALLRDVPFASYETDARVEQACSDLSRHAALAAPRVDTQVTPATLFRGVTRGDLAGPYVSQFLLQDIAMRPMRWEQRMQTAAEGDDHLTRRDAWLAVQNGSHTPPSRFDPKPRYIRCGRDLAEYVHRDFSYQPFLAACLMLLRWGGPPDGGDPYAHSETQSGFVTFGAPFALHHLATVAQLALEASWFHKWLLHRRLRPEEYGGRVEAQLGGGIDQGLPAELLGSSAMDASRQAHGSFLLPQAYPEGCPTHPSYPAAHAVIAGACVTVLKGLFDESFVVPAPVVAAPDGLSLRRWEGSPLPVGDELDKLAGNVSLGRDFAGVHYRSDSSAGLVLGELLALAYLADVRLTCPELFAGLSVRRFDGIRVSV